MNLRDLNAATITALAALAAAAVLVFTSGGHQETGTQALNGGSFTTAYRASWGLTERHSQIGSTRYQLSSTGAPVNGLGIPPAGTIGITVSEAPASALSVLHLAGAPPDTAADEQSAVELLPNAVGVPSGAVATVRVAPPHATTLDGADAAEEAYTYELAGRQIMQMDVLSHHDRRIVLAELDAETTLAPAGRVALKMITGDWRWR